MSEAGELPEQIPCPACGVDAVVPILYGLPVAEPPDDVGVGGCMPHDDMWACRACGWSGRTLLPIRTRPTERQIKDSAELADRLIEVRYAAKHPWLAERSGGPG
jgi:rubredoxin